MTQNTIHNIPETIRHSNEEPLKFNVPEGKYEINGAYHKIEAGTPLTLKPNITYTIKKLS